MMKENRGLWRGKRIDGSGTWIEGLLSYRDYELSSAQLYNEKDYEEFWVDPSTLGECTGLRDKNGKLIFEGDVVLAYYNPEEKKAIGTICYGKFMDTDSLDDYGYLGWYIDVQDHCISMLQPESDGIYLEVIGNIHDNPKLLNATFEEE